MRHEDKQSDVSLALSKTADSFKGAAAVRGGASESTQKGAPREVENKIEGATPSSYPQQDELEVDQEDVSAAKLAHEALVETEVE